MILSLLVYRVDDTRADSIAWTNSSGGSFHDPANWQGNVVPTADDSVYFLLDAKHDMPYSVSVEHDWAVNVFAVHNDAVQVNLQGHSLSTKSSYRNSILVGVYPSNAGYLSLINGTLQGSSASLADFNDSIGVLEMAGVEARLELSSEIVIGGHGQGRFKATDNSTIIVGTSGVWVGGNPATGHHGTGTIEIESGAILLCSSTSYLGAYGGSAFAKITGEGSTWANDSTLLVGSVGTGELIIEDDGSAINLFGSIGGSSGAQGNVTVNGGTWINESSLAVGGNGTGELLIENQGIVTTGALSYIGLGTNSQGNAIVKGDGSRWENARDLVLGGISRNDATGGKGVLTVSDGGAVSAGGIVKLHPNGTLNGSGGTIHGDVWNSGLVAPGNSVGTLHIEGTYLHEPPGILQMEIATESSYDKLDVLGRLDLGGGAFEVVLADGFEPAAGQLFDFLDWQTISGAGFASILLPALPNPLVWDTSSFYSRGELRITSSTAAGDFDNDGDVDGQDFLIWQRGQSPDPLSSTDLNIWKESYGAVPSMTSTTVVPEPSFSLFTLAVAIYSPIGTRYRLRLRQGCIG